MSYDDGWEPDYDALDPLAGESLLGDFVDALTPGVTGRWLVTTDGSRHIWDLDAMTYTRLPGADSVAGAPNLDDQPHRISRVESWPTVGSRAVVWFYDPDVPQAFKHLRQSALIRSIERLGADPADG